MNRLLKYMITGFLCAPLTFSQNTSQTKVDLNGVWLDNGREVQITDSGGSVTAKYVQARTCDARDGSTPKPFDTDFTGTFDGTSIKGKATVCNWGKEWGSKIGIQEADMTLKLSADQMTLTGTYAGWKGPQSMTLTRTCKPDKQKLCSAIASARATVSKMIDTDFHTPTAQEWQQTLSSSKQRLSDDLNQLRNLLCDDPSAQSKVDAMLAQLESLRPGAATTPKQIVNEQKIVAGIDLDLKDQGSKSCGSSSSSSSSKSDCPSGSKPKGAQEDAALKQVTDAIEQTIRDLDKELREIEPGSANTQQVNALRGKLSKARQYLGYWTKIKAVNCLPPEIPQLIKRIMAGDDSWCTNLCDVTGDWFNKINPSPNEDYQKKLFKEFCMANCGPGSKQI